MTSKKHYICMIICILSCSTMYAQELSEKINVQQQPASLFREALKIDLSKSPDASFFSLPSSRSNYFSRQANNRWYPLKGELYLYSETEIAGYIYNEIGQNGLLDKRISIGIVPGVYDSTVCVMNRTSYNRGKDLIDTVYNYIKRPDGFYQSELRRTYSYHYFDHFETDSFYYEAIYHVWNDANSQWDNWLRQKEGYHDTIVEFNDRTEIYNGQGDTWTDSGYLYYFATYDYRGYVDTLYLTFDCVNKFPSQKYAFIYDEQGRYTQVDYFYKNGNNWIKDRVDSEITWTEWNGFTYSNSVVIGEERATPYKRSKIESYYIGDTETFLYFYQRQWDINGTKSTSDTVWRVIDGERHYRNITDRIYNEYGDFIKYGETYYDEDGKMDYWEWYNKRLYDDIYGMTEVMTYLVQLLDDGKMDTLFYNGMKYTEFAPVSIVEHPQTKQTLDIAPNPTSGTITISATAEIAQLQIFDIVGRLVSSQSPENRQVVFDTGVLPQGIYLVQARLKDGGVQTGKVVKQ